MLIEKDVNRHLWLDPISLGFETIKTRSTTKAMKDEIRDWYLQKNVHGCVPHNQEQEIDQIIATAKLC